MGRRKKNKWPHIMAETSRPAANQAHDEARHYSLRELEFIDLVDTAGITMPWQFRNWRRFYINEERFLACAEHWLDLKLQGVDSRIETDHDKGMTRRQPVVVASSPTWRERYQEDDDPYQGWSWGERWPNHSAYSQRRLPLEPKIPAPSQLSGDVHVAI